MQTNKYSARRDFLKKIPLALVAFSSFTFIRLNKSRTYSERKFRKLTVSEANKIIRETDFPVKTELKPLSAPQTTKNQDI